MESRGYDRIVEAVADRFGKLRAGTPEMDLDLGPLINPRQKKRVETFCDNAAAYGVPLIAAGSICPWRATAGLLCSTEALWPRGPQEMLARDEVFGPYTFCDPIRQRSRCRRASKWNRFRSDRRSSGAKTPSAPFASHEGSGPAKSILTPTERVAASNCHSAARETLATVARREWRRFWNFPR